MAINPSQLRKNIYRILDQVLDTGVPIVIERRGRRLRIVPIEAPGKLEHLEPHPDYFGCDPESIVHVDWSKAWEGEPELELP